MCSAKKEVDFFGRKLYVVKTGSMEPTIEVDTVILVKKTDVTSLDNKTIITFDFNDALGIPNTHRIVGYYYKYYEDGKEKYDSTFDYKSVEEFELLYGAVPLEKEDIKHNIIEWNKFVSILVK